MDEFKPDNETKGDNSLKPDTSDRPERRTNRPRSNPLKNARFSVSRQQMMIGVGVLVLILLIIAISSALKSPETTEPTSPANTERNIDLSQQPSSVTPSENGQPSTPQSISGQDIQPATPPSQNLPPMIDSQGQRVEIPGDIVDSLNQQQAGINQATSQQLNAQQPKPVQPVTQPPVTKPVQKPAEVKTPPAKPVTPPATTQPKPTTTKPVVSGSLSAGNLNAIPATNYTLQLSGASRQDTLEAFAKKNLNGNYAIYKTQRNGNPWYVLIYGNYRNISEAKQAVSSLPAPVQAKQPWVRPMKHVHQDLKK
ncbi:SPOR domain-containing protein [Proteus sp. G2618]|uniref:SPOR domain-containing protein n=1 Tax=Proteus TaxID=583 RepID=UPI000D6989EC|nr:MULTISPECIES: SPOR domain-containing protein [Proteus]MBG5950564.1 SPOR domain-containing protein [Proteus terrae]MCE9838310.1 SPOR domain-containing protein [Proteus terrae]NBN70240.1 SPOR domain-containing protein [Proteus sp. G2618]